MNGKFNKTGVWTIVVLILLSLVLSACDSSSQSEVTTGSWAGKVEGTDAFIGIASNGKEVIAYVCDGQSISQWFKGQINSNSLELSANGATLRLDLAVDSASGTVTLADGGSFNFTADRASGDAGLYRLDESANGEDFVSGWVVLNDGQLRGLKVGSKGTFEPLRSLGDGSVRFDEDPTKPY